MTEKAPFGSATKARQLSPQPTEGANLTAVRPLLQCKCHADATLPRLATLMDEAPVSDGPLDGLSGVVQQESAHLESHDRGIARSA